MANEWNVSFPIDHTLVSDYPLEIRKLKTSTKTQLDHEHETPVDGDATGSEHSLGSSVAFMGTATPTTRPGGVALAANNIDKGRFWLDDNFDPPALKRWDGAAFESVDVASAGVTPTADDSESNAMLKAHAYLAQTSGFVNAFLSNNVSAISAFVGATDDPVGAGTQIDLSQDEEGGGAASVTAFVPNGSYFEITAGTATPTITWTALVPGGGAPVDQD